MVNLHGPKEKRSIKDLFKDISKHQCVCLAKIHCLQNDIFYKNKLFLTIRHVALFNMCKTYKSLLNELHLRNGSKYID